MRHFFVLYLLIEPVVLLVEPLMLLLFDWPM
jgi:hypothetical protein